MDDTVTVRRNITVLTAAQALGGSSAPIVMSLGGLVGQQLADNPAWVTLPVSPNGAPTASTRSPVRASTREATPFAPRGGVATSRVAGQCRATTRP